MDLTFDVIEKFARFKDPSYILYTNYPLPQCAERPARDRLLCRSGRDGIKENCVKPTDPHHDLKLTNRRPMLH